MPTNLLNPTAFRNCIVNMDLKLKSPDKIKIEAETNNLQSLTKKTQQSATDTEISRHLNSSHEWRFEEAE